MECLVDYKDVLFVAAILVKIQQRNCNAILIHGAVAKLQFCQKSRRTERLLLDANVQVDDDDEDPG